MAAVNISSDIGAKEYKICHCFQFLHIYLLLSDGPRYHDLSFLNVEFQGSFSTLFFTLIKSSPLLSTIKLVIISAYLQSAYLRLLKFLLANLTLACESSSPALCVIYSAYKLKAGWQYTALSYSFPNIEPVCFSMSGSDISWFTHRFLSRQAWWFGITIPLRICHSLLWSTQSKDDAMKMRHSICQQIWKTQQWPQDWKRSVFIPIPKKGNAKECSDYHTVALVSQTSKVMLKILEARLQ